MLEARIIQQTPERLRANLSLPDMLVAVEPGSSGGLRVIAVKYRDVLQPDGRIELRECLFVACFRNDVVSGNVSVAGVNAGSDWNVIS